MIRNSWRKAYRQLFSFQKSDRNAAVIIAIVLLIVVFLNAVVPRFQKAGGRDFSALEALLDSLGKKELEESKPPKRVLFAFDPNLISAEQLDSLDLPERVKHNLLNYRKAGGSFQGVADLRKIYGMNDSMFHAVESYIRIPQPQPIRSREKTGTNADEAVFTGTIDLNQATYDQLLAFGLSGFQASNLVKYREKGGVFRQESDLLKIYGIDSLFFMKVREHVRISPSLAVSFPEAAKSPPVLELNSADTTTLKALPGIGSVFAARIVKYRNLLGGFYTPAQLLEVYHFQQQTYEQIKDRLAVDTSQLQQIRVNFCDYAELLRHPYLQKEQVQQLIDTREAQGPFKSLGEVQALESFDSISFAKVRPYLSCR